MWKFYTLHYANKINNIHRSDFIKYFFTVIDCFTALPRMAITDSWNIIWGFLNVTNTSQNTILASADRVYVKIPPYYMQRFRRLYLHTQTKSIKWGHHVFESCNGIQLMKSSGGKLWISLVAVLTTLGLRNATFEQLLYFLAEKYEYIIVLVSTDELLGLFYILHNFYCFFDHMKKN